MKQYKIIDRVVVSAIIDNEIHRFPFDENSNVTLQIIKDAVTLINSDGEKFLTTNKPIKEFMDKLKEI